MAGKKRMATEHDGWLGEPFASDFGAAWGIILREDIYDASEHRTLLEAAKAARAKKMRYVAFAPENHRMSPRIKSGERKLYVRKGNACLEIYYYLHHREAQNDKAVLKYADDPKYRAQIAAGGTRWREENRELNRELQRGYASDRNERIQSDPELAEENRETRNVYMRSYMPDYYARNPDKLEAKRKADRERKRQRKDD